MKMSDSERCASGITGFDALCQGGFVRDSVNTVMGGPGAGKSLFLLQFLWNGVTKFDENGLYLSLEPDVMDIFNDAREMGWDFSKYDAGGQCKFMKINASSVVDGSIKPEITKLISKFEIKRICMDPVSVLSMSVEKEHQMRATIYDLVSMFKRLGVTVLLSDETETTSVGTPLNDSVDKDLFLKFLSDGLVELYTMGLGGESDRAIRISKMRRTNHAMGPVPLSITSKGLIVDSKS